jgi:hypothetical protein
MKVVTLKHFKRMIRDCRLNKMNHFLTLFMNCGNGMFTLAIHVPLTKYSSNTYTFKQEPQTESWKCYLPLIQCYKNDLGMYFVVYPFMYHNVQSFVQTRNANGDIFSSDVHHVTDLRKSFGKRIEYNQLPNDLQGSVIEILKQYANA